MSGILIGVKATGETINVHLTDDGKFLCAFDTSGQLVQLDDTDKIAMSLYGKGSVAGDTPIEVSTLSSDGVSAPSGLDVNNYPMGWNGTSFDRIRINDEGVIMASAARTTSTNSILMRNYNARSLIIFFHVSAYTAGGNLLPSIWSGDPVSGFSFKTWEAAVLITSTGLKTYLFGVGQTGGLWTEQLEVQIPRSYKIRGTQVEDKSITYSVGYAGMV